MRGVGSLRVSVLGPIRAWDPEGHEVTPSGELQRRLLALLVLHRGEVVTVDAAVDALWPDEQPRDSVAALQTHLSRLRGVLPTDLVASTAAGYRLDPARVRVDADELTELVNASIGGGNADPAAFVTRLESALEGWRGPAYPELADTDAGRIAANRLEELRVRAFEASAEARLSLGAIDGLAADVAALAQEHPLRERPRALLIDVLVAQGRSVEALRVYDDFRRLLADELGVEPSPVLAARHAELLRGSGASWTPARRLPVPVTSLIGREDLLDYVVGLATGHRLVTLVGPGGVGKTRLLLQVAHCLHAMAPERPIVMCELATADADSALDVVAAALSIDRRMDVGLIERIASVVASAEVVLLFDNCEHVLDPIAELAERLLTACPHVSIVATSRERLRIAGEQLCVVPPLRVTDDGPAEQLFIERARAVSQDFDPGQEERAVIAEIARRLDGLPLAIELAAARLHTLDVREVANGLDRRFRLLSSGPRTSSRHGSLGGAVSWSYDMLDDRLRTCFADLSVFAGSFTATDAAAVCGLDLADAAAALDQLTERSLVMRAPGRRFVLLETLRAFGAEQLAELKRSTESGGRHAHYMAEWVEGTTLRMFTEDGVDVLSEFDFALPELRVALGWLLEHGDIETAGRMVVAMDHYCFLRLRPDVNAWADRVVAADPDDASPLAAHVWAQAALASWMAGDVAETARRSARAIEVARRRGDELPAIVMETAGSSALFEGRLADSIEWYERAAEADPDNAPRRLIIAGTRLLALGYAGDPAAPDAADELLARVGERRTAFTAFAWYCAGEALLNVDPVLARYRLSRAIEIAAVTGASVVTGIAGGSRASLEARFGDPTVAAEEFRQLLLHWRRAGMWSAQWTMLRTVATLLDALGRPRDAAVLVGAVLGTTEGHHIFGDDAVALGELIERLRAQLGDDYESSFAEGTVLDGDAAVEHALRSL